MVLIIDHDTTFAGLVLFGAVVATDWVDGVIARATGQVSELGKVLDPVADRLAIAAGLIALVVRDAFPLWAALLILVRDVAILIAGLVLLSTRCIRIEVRYLGKVATFTLMTAIGFIAWGRSGTHSPRRRSRAAGPSTSRGSSSTTCDGLLRRRRGAPGHRVQLPWSSPTTCGTRRNTSGSATKAPDARVGITDYAQDALGDVVYVDVPQTETEVTAGRPFSEVESTKSVSDVYAPVSGKVVDRNAQLEDRSELVNEAPYGDGWLWWSR